MCERNPRNRYQAEPTQHDRQQPGQKQQGHTATGPSPPASTLSCRILEDRRSAAARRSDAHQPSAPSLFKNNVYRQDVPTKGRHIVCHWPSHRSPDNAELPEFEKDEQDGSANRSSEHLELVSIDDQPTGCDRLPSKRLPQRAPRRQPAKRLSRDLLHELEIAVVVEQLDARGFGRGGDQEVGGLHRLLVIGPESG